VTVIQRFDSALGLNVHFPSEMDPVLRAHFTARRCYSVCPR
jgi:hypothetical protein